MIKDKPFLTTSEASKLLGFTPDHVRRLISRRLIKATRIGRAWLIRPQDLKYKRKRKDKHTDGNGINE